MLSASVRPPLARHEVSIFLLGPAAEIETIGDERFDVQKLPFRFDELGGVALSCGTSLSIPEMDAGALCPMSTMDELVRPTERVGSSAHLRLGTRSLLILLQDSPKHARRISVPGRATCPPWGRENRRGPFAYPVG